MQPSSADRITFSFDAQTMEARPGDSVAAALLLNGVRHTRNTAVSGTPRAPYCMMGACYECLVLIEGRTVQACMIAVQQGMVVQRVPRPTPDND